MKKILAFFNKNNDKLPNVSPDVISAAYKTREKEIESLRKYDRGEKTITPASLKNIVRSL
jgi:hypothetical protein